MKTLMTEEPDLTSAIFRVLAASDQSVHEYDIIKQVLSDIKQPEHLWFQRILDRLSKLQDENRVFLFQRKVIQRDLGCDVECMERTYILVNPLDGLAAI
jgi:hypothetical protein